MKYEFKDNCLDVFRLLAAICVMLVHGINTLGVNTPKEIKSFMGSLGVSVLYLLCGYFTYASFDKRGSQKEDGNKLKNFYFNRFIRIYPPIWGSILLLVWLNFILGNNILNPAYICVTLMEAILPRGGAERIGDYITNGSLWTMPFEIQFYLFFPLLYKILEKLKKSFFIILLVFLMVLNIVAYRVDYFFYNLPLPQIFYILYNMVILPYLYVFMAGCYIYKYREEIFNKICKGRMIILTIIVFCIWKIIYTYNTSVHFGKLYNPITTLLLAVIVFGIGYKKKLRLKMDLSYGIYIYHMIIVNTLLVVGKSGFKALCIVCVCSPIIAVVSYFLIEKPLKKIKRV